MGQPIVVRTDFTAVEVRRLARRVRTAIRSGGFWRLLRCSMAHRGPRPPRSAGWTGRRFATG
jgi:hypothetical protein